MVIIYVRGTLLEAVLGTITSTFTVHIKSMAVSNIFTTVGLIDNGAMTPASAWSAQAGNWRTLLVEYNQEIFLEATINITLVACIVFLHYLLSSWLRLSTRHSLIPLSRIPRVASSSLNPSIRREVLFHSVVCSYHHVLNIQST